MSEVSPAKVKRKLSVKKRDQSKSPMQKQSRSRTRQGARSASPSKRQAAALDHTRPCTPVIYLDSPAMDETKIEERRVVRIAEFRVQPFTVATQLDKEVLTEMARELLKAERQAEVVARPIRPEGPATRQQTWKEKVNQQRDRARAEMLEGEVANLGVLAARLGVHRSTAKKLRDRHFLTGSIPTFDYNNQHLPGTADAVVGLMNSAEGHYFSTGDVKRRMPGLSRRFIARTLKQRGFRYRRITHTRRLRRFEEPDVCRVLSTCLPAFDRADESLLFLDEVVFPFNHTPRYCWRNADQPLGGFKERTICKGKLIVIALCSKTRMIAIQVHTQEMQGQAIVHFLTEALARLDTQDRVTVLLDNAKYHTSLFINQSSIGKYLVFNVAKCWELNMIEVFFSKIKHRWQTRAVVRRREDEVEQLIRMFRECQVAEDFGGYRRQYLRNVQEILRNVKPPAEG